MSARQLNRLAKAKGLDPLLGGSLNVDSDESDVLEDSEEEGGNFARGAISASVRGDFTSAACVCGYTSVVVYLPFNCVNCEEPKCVGPTRESLSIYGVYI